MATIKQPEEGDQFSIGASNSSIYVTNVTENADQWGGFGHGRTRVDGHDDNGDEVTVFFYPRDPEDGWPDEDGEYA